MRTAVWMAGLALLTAATGSAWPTTAETQVIMGGGVTSRQEARDLRTLQAATAAFRRGGYPALARHLQPLRTALERGPTVYPEIQETSPGHWVVRADDDVDGIILSAAAMTAATEASPAARVEIATQDNVYPAIALILGSEAIERHALEEAIVYLDRGLSMQPAHPALAAEKMGAMQAQGLYAEALALGDATVAAQTVPIGASQALIHRRRGFSLIELGRLAEARAAYEASLELDSASQIARQELAYIDSLEAGGPAQAPIPNGPAAPAPTDPSD